MLRWKYSASRPSHYRCTGPPAHALPLLVISRTACPNSMARRTVATSSVLLALSAFVVLAASAEGAMMGGKKPADANSAEVSAAAQEAVALLNHGEAQKLQGGPPLNGLLQLAKIKDVSTQVVSGINYFFLLTVKDAQGKEHDLELTLWSRPWLAAKNDVKNPANQLTSVTYVSADA